MAYLELSLELQALDREAVEAACFAAGALAVTLIDAGDEAVFEPLPGELRLWQRTRLQALFDAAQVDAALIAQLAAAIGVQPAQLAARSVAERVWEREWLRDFHAMQFGRRLWIAPKHETVAQSDAGVVKLDPGLAFGTGSHPSTALCLQWLDQAQVEGRRAVDYGCGSGVLAIAALKLGARTVSAYDIDPQALLATRENAADNGVAARLQICERAADIAPQCDLLLANILAEVLVSHAAQLAALVRAGGMLLLAGVLAEQRQEVANAYAKWFDMTLFGQRDIWIALAGARY